MLSDASIKYPDYLFAILLPCAAQKLMHTITAFTVWKIWSVDRQAVHRKSTDLAQYPSLRRESRLHQILLVIIDSAILYSLSVTAFVVTFEIDTKLALITSEAVSISTAIFGHSFSFSYAARPNNGN
jgi:hypothetical protein